jgi:hypothetical protein
MAIVLGDPVIITVYVISTNPSKIATGAVVLKKDKQTLGTKHLDATGAVKFVISSKLLGVGVHEMIAYHAGDKNFAATRSRPFVREVVKKD